MIHNLPNCIWYTIFLTVYDMYNLAQALNQPLVKATLHWESEIQISSVPFSYHSTAKTQTYLLHNTVGSVLHKVSLDFLKAVKNLLPLTNSNIVTTTANNLLPQSDPTGSEGQHMQNCNFICWELPAPLNNLLSFKWCS